ncbi:MAG: dTMP kinase [Clostridiales Family XIII bacterium]|nr:dTMP kinase [Clostridiales Family XIII bacterium]
MTRGRFIVFEGIDGSGKSTQARLLHQRLVGMGLASHCTSEPTGGPIGALIRDCLAGRIHLDERAIASLFAADRLDHLLNEADGIAAKVSAGAAVISDRYYFSSYAYHGAFMPMGWVIEANALSREILRPDVNIFIDAPPEACVARISGSRGNIEKYEKIDVLTKVREQYFIAFERMKGSENVVVIDGAGPVQETERRIWDCVKAIL